MKTKKIFAAVITFVIAFSVSFVFGDNVIRGTFWKDILGDPVANSSIQSLVTSLKNYSVEHGGSSSETAASIRAKLQAASAANAGYLMDSDWSVFNAKGDVTGPTSTTENNIPLWDSITKKLKDGLAYATSAVANSIVRRDESANIYANLFYDKDGLVAASAAQSASLAVYNYTQDFWVTEAMDGALITNYGATSDITATLPQCSSLSKPVRVGVGNKKSLIESSCVLFLKFENNSTDSSTNDFTPVGTNGVTYSSTSKYGNYSASFITQGSNVQYSTNSAFDVAAGDFTIQTWIYLNSSGANAWRGICGTYWNAGGGIVLYLSDSGNLVFAYNANQSFTRTWSPSWNTWYHIAVSRHGADLKFWVDGSQLGETCNLGTTSINFSSYGFAVGCDGTGVGTSLRGLMDNFRFDKGISLFNTSFTPPEYPNKDITLTPHSNDQLPGTAAAGSSLKSSAKNDSINLILDPTAGIIAESAYPAVANWVDQMDGE